MLNADEDRQDRVIEAYGRGPGEYAHSPLGSRVTQAIHPVRRRSSLSYVTMGSNERVMSA